MPRYHIDRLFIWNTYKDCFLYNYFLISCFCFFILCISPFYTSSSLIHILHISYLYASICYTCNLYDFQRIRELGGALAASWRDATHLIMSAPLRTVKLLCCLSRCKFIVSLQWLLDCSAKNTFVDESAYMLGDAEFEKNFNCNIEKALASPNRGTVLKVIKLNSLIIIYRESDS